MKITNLNKTIFSIILSLLVTSQVAYLYITINTFRKTYYEAVNSNLITVGKYLEANIEYILQLDISIYKLVKIDSSLKAILSDVPWVKDIFIEDRHRNIIYYCDRKGFYKAKRDKVKNSTKTLKNITTKGLSFPLNKKNGNIVGKLVLGIDKALINERLKEITWDTGTVILIAILTTFDLLFFIIAYAITSPLKKASEEIRLSCKEGNLSFPISPTKISFIDLKIGHFIR